MIPVPDAAAQTAGPPRDLPLQSGLKPGYDVFIIVVTVLSIINWVFLLIPANLGNDTRSLLIFMEPIFIVILLLDFALRLRLAKGARWRYMNHGGGWFDLIGSLPYGRILRLFRLIRVLQAFHHYGWKDTVSWFIVNRAQGTLFLVMAFLLVVLEGGGLLVLYFEAGAPGSNIETGGEALWWGVVTITTVGYGDFYPVTPGGQVVATIMIFSGVALIAIFTAWVASSFLTPSSSAQGTDAPTPEVGEATPRVRAMEGNDPGAIIHDLRDRIDALEQALLHHGKRPD